VVLQRRVNPFYRFFGLQQRGRFGKKETIDSSMVKNAQLCRWLIKLSRLLFVVEGEVPFISPQLSWLMAFTLHYFGHWLIVSCLSVFVAVSLW